MRFNTQALRILFGLHVVVTFSPDEGHNLLMVRVARTRANDTCVSNDSFEKENTIYGVDLPNVKQSDDDVTIGVSVDTIHPLPSYDIRRQHISWRRIGIRRLFQNNDTAYV